MNRDVVELITALTLIGACAGFAISTAAPPRQKSEPGEGGLEIEARRRRDHQAVAEAPSAQGVLSAPAAPFEAAVAAVAVADRTRPRIFTGEPAPPEAGRPATRRALKLVGGPCESFGDEVVTEVHDERLGADEGLGALRGVCQPARLGL